jgi:hypothetical protein
MKRNGGKPMTDHQNVTTSDLARAKSEGDTDEREVADERQVGEEAQAEQAERGAQQPEAVGPVVAEQPGSNETKAEKAATDRDEIATDRDEPAAREPLLPPDQMERFTERWHEIQAGFVDRPRESVEEADGLVADLMQRLAASFSNERDRLEGQWDKGDDVSTEELRVVLTRYRSFFDRLLAA